MLSYCRNSQNFCEVQDTRVLCHMSLRQGLTAQPEQACDHQGLRKLQPCHWVTKKGPEDGGEGPQRSWQR